MCGFYLLYLFISYFILAGILLAMVEYYSTQLCCINLVMGNQTLALK